MLDYLDKLRAKPVHVRRRIAWVTTTTLSLMVASVAWNTWSTEIAAPAFAAAPTRSPLGVVSDVFAQGKEAMMAAVADAKSQLQSAAEGSVAPYAQSAQSTASTSTVSSNKNAAEEVIVDAAVFAEVPSSYVPGEAIHTRPGSLQNRATGTTSDDNMIQ